MSHIILMYPAYIESNRHLIFHNSYDNSVHMKVFSQLRHQLNKNKFFQIRLGYFQFWLLEHNNRLVCILLDTNQNYTNLLDNLVEEGLRGGSDWPYIIHIILTLNYIRSGFKKYKNIVEYKSCTELFVLGLLLDIY